MTARALLAPITQRLRWVMEVLIETSRSAGVRSQLGGKPYCLTTTQTSALLSALIGG